MRTTALAATILAVAFSVSLAALTPEDLAALDRLPGSDTPIVMRFEGRPLAEVVRAIATAAGPFKVTFDEDVGDRIVNADWGKQSQKQALIRLATENGLAYAVPEKDHLVVRARAKRE